jgi:hypothetical protein
LSKLTLNIILSFTLLFVPVMYSFTPDDVKVFRDSNSTIYLQLPNTWNVQIHEDENSIQMFVSREQELFTAGVIVTKIYNVASVYNVNLRSDNELVNFWSQRLLKASEHYNHSEEISSSRYSCGRYSGLKKEFLHQYHENIEPVHTYTLILAHNGNILTLVAVAPEKEWQEYAPVFDAAIKSLDLK